MNSYANGWQALATPAEQKHTGLEDTLTLLETLTPELDGVYLIAPGNRWRCHLPLLDRLRAHDSAGCAMLHAV